MRTLTAVLLLLCLLPFGATRAGIVIIHVTSPADHGPNTLRQAIIDGNGLAANDLPRILIDLDRNSPIVLASPLPTLSAGYFAFYGTKASRAVIDGGNAHQILRTSSSVLLFELRNVTLLNGFSGVGGITCLGMALPASTGYALLENVRFEGCKQSGVGVVNGGALFTGHNLTINDSEFLNNESVGTNGVQGGAIFIWDSAAVTISRTIFAGNRAVSNGPVNSARASGGAIAMWHGKSLTIEDSVFANNHAQTPNDPDPRIRMGGALDISTSEGLVVRRSTFFGNTAGDGGAIYYLGTLSMRNVTAFNNRATTGVGGFMRTSGPLTLYNNTFWRNYAAIAGDNLAGWGSGQIHGAYNNLFAAGTGAGDSCTGFTPTSSAGYNIVPTIECGLGRGNTDKVTTDLHIRGAYLGSGRDLDYTVQLYARSPALDAGNPQAPDDRILERCAETDVLGQPRPVDVRGTGAAARCDIGSLEAQSEPSLFIDDFEPGWLRP